MNQAASIGIIGGADGPTAIFVSGAFPLLPVIAGGVVLIAAVVIAIAFFKK